MDIGHILVHIADSLETANVTEAAKHVQSPPIPPKFSLTERVLVHMMRENTGASILDSGGAYGRAWQRNLTRDFAAVEDATIRGHVYKSTYGARGATVPEHNRLSLDVTIDLFTYLASRLDYDRALTRAFRKFAADRDSRGWLEDMEDFPAFIAEKRDVDACNVYHGNSYNEDNFLSGTVQYTCFNLDGEEYVLLQIHGGCDVRGGYTAPAVFKIDDNCGTFGDWYNADVAPDWKEVNRIREGLKADLATQTFLFPEVEAQVRGEVEAYGEDVYWSVGGCEDHGEGAAKNLDDYPCEEIEDRSQWKRGTVCVLSDGTVLCPETGAKLVAGFVH